MNRILATILATLNALLGFVLIFGSIWFAKFMYEQIATQQVAADMVSQAQIIDDCRARDWDSDSRLFLRCHCLFSLHRRPFTGH